MKKKILLNTRKPKIIVFEKGGRWENIDGNEKERSGDCEKVEIFRSKFEKY